MFRKLIGPVLEYLQKYHIQINFPCTQLCFDIWRKFLLGSLLNIKFDTIHVLVYFKLLSLLIRIAYSDILHL